MLTLVIFFAGLPLFFWIIRMSRIPGGNLLLAAYLFLFLSNICTVVEDISFGWLFNFCEHASIALFAAFLLAAIVCVIRTDEPQT
ncbi:hypothetical protein JXA32_13845 [Candidatus Sumerlaeota bacterium]|nr:hypothetical protein [Candidatus Sumerlaeota bacterium]